MESVAFLTQHLCSGPSPAPQLPGNSSQSLPVLPDISESRPLDGEDEDTGWGPISGKLPNWCVPIPSLSPDSELQSNVTRINGRSSPGWLIG